MARLVVDVATGRDANATNLGSECIGQIVACGKKGWIRCVTLAANSGTALALPKIGRSTRNKVKCEFGVDRRVSPFKFIVAMTSNSLARVSTCWRVMSAMESCVKR